MTVLRRVARPLLAAAFIAEGLDAVRHPEAHLSIVEPFRPQLKKVTDAAGLPDDPRLVVRATGAVSLAAAFALATNRLPRVAALVLAAVTTPIALARNPVWAAQGAVQRKEYAAGALRSLSLLGGLLIAAADTAGKPSIGWRMEHARKAKAKAAASS